VIVVDTREQEPLCFERLQSRAGSLVSGDYSIAGMESLFSVERKTIPDLIGCCVGENRERFERELHRLRGFRFKRLLIVGTEEQILQGLYNHTNIRPRAVWATLCAFEVRYEVPLVFRASPALAARQIESWAYWYSREMVCVANEMRRALEVQTEAVGKPSPAP